VGALQMRLRENIRLANYLIATSVPFQIAILYLMFSAGSTLYLNIAAFVSLILMAIVRDIKLKWRMPFVDIFKPWGKLQTNKDEWKVMIFYIPTFLGIADIFNRFTNDGSLSSYLTVLNLLIFVSLSIKEFFQRIKF
jgi:hypothetical protein